MYTLIMDKALTHISICTYRNDKRLINEEFNTEIIVYGSIPVFSTATVEVPNASHIPCIFKDLVHIWVEGGTWAQKGSFGNKRSLTDC